MRRRPKTTYSLHHRGTLLLRLVLVTCKEAAKETRFLLLSIYIEILVVVERAWRQLSTLTTLNRWRGLVRIHAVGDNRHGLGLPFRSKSICKMERFILPCVRSRNQGAWCSRSTLASYSKGSNECKVLAAVNKLYVRNHVSHKLRGGPHCGLEEVDHNRVEPILELWVPPESLL